jgi:hypothetical protein
VQAIVKICQKRDEFFVEDAEGSRLSVDGVSRDSDDIKSGNPLHKLSPLATQDFFATLRKSAVFAGDNARLADLQQRFCSLYGVVFCGGSPETAEADLFMKSRAQARAEASSSNSQAGARTFRLGFRVGCCLLLAAWVAWDVGIDFAYLSHEQQLNDHGTCHKTGRLERKSVMNVWLKADFPLYRAMLSLALALWCWGGILWALSKCRINFLYILELDPRTTGSATEALWEASTITIVILGSFIIHFKVLRCNFPSDPLPLGFWPLVPLLTIIFRAFSPWSYRQFAWKSLWGVVRSPFVTVTFIQNFAGRDYCCRASHSCSYLKTNCVHDPAHPFFMDFQAMS